MSEDILDQIKRGTIYSAQDTFDPGGVHAPQAMHTAAQSYFLLQILERLEHINKALNLISMQISLISLKADKQDETDVS